MRKKIIFTLLFLLAFYKPIVADIELISKIAPKAGGFTGMVDAKHVIGGGESGTLPPECETDPNVDTPAEIEAILADYDLDLGTGSVTAASFSGGGLDADDLSDNSISDLSDVNTSGWSTNKLLKFDASGNLVVGNDNNTTYSAGTGLDLAGTVFSLSHLGLENLSDPDANRLLYWDNSSNKIDWLDYSSWDTNASDDLLSTDLDTESELETQLTDVTNIYTNNDGSLDDDDLSDNNLSDLSDIGTVSYTAGQYLRADGTDYDSSSIQDGDLPSSITRDTEWDTVTEIETATGEDLVVSTEIDTETELESLLTDVTDIYTNNDGSLDDDDLSDNSTDDLSEGSNLYYTDARARGAISETVTGLDYNNTTGVLSLTSGYVIPTTTKESNWDTAYGWGDHSGLYLELDGESTDVTNGSFDFTTTGDLSVGSITADGNSTTGITLNQGEHSVGFKAFGYDNRDDKYISMYINYAGDGILSSNSDLFIGYGGSVFTQCAANKNAYIILGDQAGAKSLQILDYGWHIVAQIDSDGNFKTGTSTVIDGNGFFRPTSSDDSSAPNNSIYYSTTQSKLVYKDSGGSVHTLY